MSIAQQTFRKVIAADLYHGNHTNSRDFMCLSLEQALIRGVITKEECDIARQEIQDCLARSGTDNTSFGGMASTLLRTGRNTSLHQHNGNYYHIFFHWDTMNPFPKPSEADDMNTNHIFRFPDTHKFYMYGYDMKNKRVLSFKRDSNGLPMADHHPMRLNDIPTTKVEVENIVRFLTSSVNKQPQPQPLELVFPITYFLVDDDKVLDSKTFTANTKRHLHDQISSLMKEYGVSSVQLHIVSSAPITVRTETILTGI